MPTKTSKSVRLTSKHVRPIAVDPPELAIGGKPRNRKPKTKKQDNSSSSKILNNIPLPDLTQLMFEAGFINYARFAAFIKKPVETVRWLMQRKGNPSTQKKQTVPGLDAALAIAIGLKKPLLFLWPQLRPDFDMKQAPTGWTMPDDFSFLGQAKK